MPPRSSARSAAQPGKAAVFLALTLVVVSGCASTAPPEGSPSPSPSLSPTLAPLAEQIPKPLHTYYEQRLRWHDCAGQPGFECSTMRVPLDYERPRAGEEVRIAVSRKKATAGNRIGSLLVNPGGPGGSAVDYLQQAAASSYPAPVRARYDMVAFDPRGVGHSHPVKCGKEYAHDPTPDTPAEVSGVVKAAKSFAAACEKNGGELLAHVSTVEAARDMDVLRALLGDDKLHYVGKSYGSLLGATYAGLFPSRVGRLVLDGAMDPTLDAREKLRVQAHASNVAFDSFAGDCVKRSGCPLGSSVKEAGTRLDALMRRVEDKPMPAKDGGSTLDELHAYAGVQSALGDAHSWPDLREALQAAEQGDGSGLVQLSGEAENPDDSNIAVRCLDQPPAFTGPQSLKAALPAFEKASPRFGRAGAWEGLDCTYWPVKATGGQHRIEAEGADPILVIGASRDPATPHAWAKSLAGQLDSGVLLTYDGDGHTAYTQGSACVDATVNDYLLHGKAPQNGKRCG